VFRPATDPDTFTLVDQSVCQLTEGELLIDTTAKPLNVKRGDVIGFHIINKAIIPYDVDEGTPAPFYYLMTDKNPVKGGPSLKMDTSEENGIRTYSLMAKIISGKQYTNYTCKIMLILYAQSCTGTIFIFYFYKYKWPMAFNHTITITIIDITAIKINDN
jgi:hypothetical protein